jgi:hypothetical protein
MRSPFSSKAIEPESAKAGQNRMHNVVTSPEACPSSAGAHWGRHLAHTFFTRLMLCAFRYSCLMLRVLHNMCQTFKHATHTFRVRLANCCCVIRHGTHCQPQRQCRTVPVAPRLLSPPLGAPSPAPSATMTMS